MVSNKALTGLAVVAVLLALTAGTAFAIADTPGANTHNRTISVVGSGEIDAEPNAAVVRVSVRATAADPGEVSTQLANDADALRSAVSDFGIPSENVQTSSYYVREDHRDRPESTETRYMGEHSFEVTLEDVDRVGALIDTVTSAGADDVGGVEYTLSETRRETLRNDALRSAVENARGEASVLATATGLEITGVTAASTQQSSVVPYRAEAVAAGDGGTEIEPRDVTVSATVHVTFGARAA